MTDVDAYLRRVAPEQRAALEKLRRTIRAAAPGAVEGTSYGLAAFRLGGRPLVAFGASKGHCSFCPMTGHTVAEFRSELKGFETSKGTIRFQPQRPLPATLVKRIVQRRISELEGVRGQKGKDKMAKTDPITAYAREQTAAFAAMCEQLRGLIDAALPKATSKVWHGSPVWFIDENPVVGYNATAKAVHLLFWNGQAFDEEDLEVVGKYQAAQAKFADSSAIDPKAVKRWLKKAKADVFDSRGFFQKMRAAAK